MTVNNHKPKWSPEPLNPTAQPPEETDMTIIDTTTGPNPFDPRPIDPGDIRPGMVIDIDQPAGCTYGHTEPAMTIRMVVTDVDDYRTADRGVDVSGWIINTTGHAPYESIDGDTITPDMWDASAYADGTWNVDADTPARHVCGGRYNPTA